MPIDTPNSSQKVVAIDAWNKNKLTLPIDSMLQTLNAAMLELCRGMPVDTFLEKFQWHFDEGFGGTGQANLRTQTLPPFYLQAVQAVFKDAGIQVSQVTKNEQPILRLLGESVARFSDVKPSDFVWRVAQSASKDRLSVISTRPDIMNRLVAVNVWLKKVQGVEGMSFQFVQNRQNMQASEFVTNRMPLSRRKAKKALLKTEEKLLRQGIPVEAREHKAEKFGLITIKGMDRIQMINADDLLKSSESEPSQGSQRRRWKLFAFHKG